MSALEAVLLALMAGLTPHQRGVRAYVLEVLSSNQRWVCRWLGIMELVAFSKVAMRCLHVVLQHRSTHLLRYATPHLLRQA